MARPADTLDTLDTPRIALLARLARRMHGGGVPDEVRRAVDVLTSAADPVRADRLAVRPGEASVLVERLAVWALRRTTEDAVAAANGILDGVQQAHGRGPLPRPVRPLRESRPTPTLASRR